MKVHHLCEGGHSAVANAPLSLAVTYQGGG